MIEGQNRKIPEKPERTEFETGCSAIAWKTEDGKHLWGRNYDFNKIAQGSRLTYLPEKTRFCTCEEKDGELKENAVQESRHAVLGVGTLLLKDSPVLYEGINEKGLIGGQLYYREFAHFEREYKKEKIPLQPVFAVMYFLAECASVEEVIQHIETKVALIGERILGALPNVHWIFTDKSGKTVIIEPDRDGIKIYRNTMGILTNSPGYEWHRTNLLNYSQIEEKDRETLYINGEEIKQCFSGTGALGMPGDWSSVSRFVRLAFLKKYYVKGSTEEEGGTNLFHILQHVAFPLGLIEVGDPVEVTPYDTKTTPYDYTVYTAVMCAESLRYYWISHKNMRVQYVDMEELIKENKIQQFELGEEIDFLCRNKKE